ncbi:MAG: hypothetical protein IJR02_13275 [Bacteroidaceae bacterium]|nr:hypothetical protein [Bacteroidaceae bacterium]
MNIILADDCTMSIGTKDNRISETSCILGDNSLQCLTIYGQSCQSGKLNAYNGSTFYAVSVKRYAQRGGNVTIDASQRGAFWLTDGDNFTFSGGTLTAIPNSLYGISTTGTVSISWTSATDRITVSKYSGTVTIADGKAFYNGSEVLTGTFTSQSDKSKLNGKTLTPAVILADNADNNTAIATAATVCTGSKTLAVKLAGRTLYKDGNWNTLCLPFDVTIADSPLKDDGVDVRTLSSSDFSNGTLTLTFTNEGAVTTMEAGKPYIIKWNNTGATLTEDDLVFENVTMSSTAADVTTNFVDFCGTFSPEVIYESGDEKHNLYLGGGNTLYYPTAEGFEVNSCRAYFVLKNGLTVGVDDLPEQSGGHTKVRAFNLSFGDEDDVTGILSTTDDTDFTDSDDAWYTLDGRKLSGKPSQRGVYIRGGRKIAVQ